MMRHNSLISPFVVVVFVLAAVGLLNLLEEVYGGYQRIQTFRQAEPGGDNAE